MRKFFMTVICLLMASGMISQVNAAESAQGISQNKILIAYFSHSGNTRLIAGQIHALVGGDPFEIKTVREYAADFDGTVDQAREDRQNNARPELTAKIENMQDYDVVFVGFPNWVGTMPMALFTFFESYDFKDKTIIPFCTHGTSGLSDTIDDLTSLCPDSEIKPALSIYRGDIRTSGDRVEAWLLEIGY